MNIREIYIGYVRRSTVGQNTDYQVLQIKNYCKTIKDNNIFKDTCSGYEHNRLGLNKMMHTILDIRKIDADIPIYLVVTGIDRISRDRNHFNKVFKFLAQNNVILRVLNISITLMNNDMTDNLYTILENYLISAETERDNIDNRCKAGKIAARQHSGYRDGRPKKYTIGEIDNAMKLLENNSYHEVERITGISKSTLIREKRNRKQGTQNNCISTAKYERTNLIVNVLGHNINCDNVIIHRGNQKIMIDKDNIIINEDGKVTKL